MKNKKNTNKPSNNRKEVIKDYNRLTIAGCVVVILALLCTVAYLVYKGNHPKLSDGRQVVASIEGRDFTAEDLYAELSKQGGYSVLVNMIDNYIIEKEVTDTTDAKTYADSVVAQYELQYEDSEVPFEDIVVSSGYESIEDFKKAIMNNYLFSEVAKKYIKENVTEKELNNYYKEHVSDELGVKHILISPDVEDDATSDEKEKAEEKALKEAKSIIEKIKKGEDFEKLAKEYSDDQGSASNGGVINNVVKDNYITEFWNAAEKLEVGKYTTEPVKSKYGYHIIYKVSHTPKKSFDEMKESLYDNVVDAKMEDDTTLVEKTWVEIRKQYKLNIEDTTIKRVYDLTVKNIDKQ